MNNLTSRPHPDILAEINQKLDLIITFFNIDGKHNSKVDMERKAPAIVVDMRNRLTKRLNKSKKDVCP